MTQPRPRLQTRGRRESLRAAAFLGPALILIGGLLVYPVLWTMRLSLYTGFGFKFDHFIGLDNYKQLLTNDPSFLDLSHFPPSGALINNLRWVVVYTTVSLGLGLLIAVLAARVRYESLIKAIVFVPMGISATAVGLIWSFVYSFNLNQGVLNAVLHGIDHGFQPVAWLGQDSTVNYAIIFAYVWASTGFAMVVLSAALKSIPEEILEAARIDGASEWPIFWRITLPMIKLPVSVVMIWLVVNVIKVFDIIYVMTRGGPGFSSQVIAYDMYTQTFENGLGGYGAAIAVVMLVLILPVMIFNVRRFRSDRIA